MDITFITLIAFGALCLFGGKFLVIGNVLTIIVLGCLVVMYINWNNEHKDKTK